MDEISGLCPQISHFIRNHGFPWSCPVRSRFRTEAQRSIGLPSDFPLSAQKQYEQDVYNFSRTLGLSVDDAERWVLKAREFWSEEKYESTNTEQGEDVGSSNEILDQPFREPSPGMFTVSLEPVEHSDQTPEISPPDSPFRERSAGDSTFRSKDAVKDNPQIMTTNDLEGAELLQHALIRYSIDFDGRSKDYRTTSPTLRPSTLTAESFVNNAVSHDNKVNATETAVEKEEKATKRARKRAAKKSRRVLQNAEKAAMKQAEEEKDQRQRGGHEQIANPQGQVVMTKIVDEMSQIEQLEDEDKFQQKKKGRKLKSELELPPQSGDHIGEQHKHKKVRVESGARGVSSRKSKTKKCGPQYSPFFPRNSLTEAEKDVNRRVNRLMVHEPSDSISKQKDAAIEEAKMLVDFPTPMI